MKPNPIPSHYPQLTASIAVSNGDAALEFYQKAFGAKIRMCLKEPSGKLGHAEIEIGRGLLMIAEKYDGFNFTPADLNGSTVTLHLYVEDVDATVAQAEAAGAKITMPPTNQFYGDRSARLTDPFGHVWAIATHVEDVSEEEMERRIKQCAGGPS